VGDIVPRKIDLHETVVLNTMTDLGERLIETDKSLLFLKRTRKDALMAQLSSYVRTMNAEILSDKWVHTDDAGSSL